MDNLSIVLKMRDSLMDKLYNLKYWWIMIDE